MGATVNYEIHLELEVETFPLGGWSRIDEIVEAVVEHSTAREAISEGIGGAAEVVAEVVAFHLEYRKLGFSCRLEDEAKRREEIAETERWLKQRWDEHARHVSDGNYEFGTCDTCRTLLLEARADHHQHAGYPTEAGWVTHYHDNVACVDAYRAHARMMSES